MALASSPLGRRRIWWCSIACSPWFRPTLEADACTLPRRETNLEPRRGSFVYSLGGVCHVPNDAPSHVVAAVVPARVGSVLSRLQSQGRCRSVQDERGKTIPGFRHTRT